MKRPSKRRLVAWVVFLTIAAYALNVARSLDDRREPASLGLTMQISKLRVEPGELPVVTVTVQNDGGSPGRIPEPFLRYASVRIQHFPEQEFKTCTPKGVAWLGTSRAIAAGGKVVYEVPGRLLSSCGVGAGTGDYQVLVSYSMPPDARAADGPSFWERRYWQGQLAEAKMFHVVTPEEQHVAELRRRRGPASGVCARLDPSTAAARAFWVQEGNRQMPCPLSPELDPVVRAVVLMDTAARASAPDYLRPHFHSLVGLLRAPEPGNRYWGVYLLDQLGGEDADRAMLDLLQRESDIQVVEAILQDLVQRKRPEIVPVLVGLLDCQVESIQRQAWQWAASVPDGRIADEMAALWEIAPAHRAETLAMLGRLRDRRGFSLALEALQLGPAVETIRATGTPSDLPQVVAAYREHKLDPRYRLELITLMLEWSNGGPDAMILAAEAFEQADDSIKPDLATWILKAQLDPSKPPPFDYDRFQRSDDCMRIDDWYQGQAPFARREVDRLLNPANGRYFRAAGFGARNEVMGPFDVVSRTSPPAERAALWRKVAALFDGAPTQSAAGNAMLQVHRPLMFALISLASASLPEDPAEALRLLDEVEAICAQAPRLEYEIRNVARGVRERAVRLQGADTSAPLARLPGRFGLSGGYGGADLTLEGEGQYRLVTHGDVPPRCPGENESTGKYHIERGWVVLQRDRPSGYLDVAEAYLPVTWGGVTYLVQYPEDFCRNLVDLRRRAEQMAAQPGTGKPCSLRDMYIGAYREIDPVLESEECFPPGPAICK